MLVGEAVAPRVEARSNARRRGRELCGFTAASRNMPCTMVPWPTRNARCRSSPRRPTPTHYRYGNDHTIFRVRLAAGAVRTAPAASAHEASLLGGEARPGKKKNTSRRQRPSTRSCGPEATIREREGQRLRCTIGVHVWAEGQQREVHGEEYVAAARAFRGRTLRGCGGRRAVARAARGGAAPHARRRRGHPRGAAARRDARALRALPCTQAQGHLARAPRSPRRTTTPKWRDLADRRSSEGNWLPFVHGRQLYAKTSICPDRVLEIEPRSGDAPVVASTPRRFASRSRTEWRLEQGDPPGTASAANPTARWWGSATARAPATATSTGISSGGGRRRRPPRRCLRAPTISASHRTSSSTRARRCAAAMATEGPEGLALEHRPRLYPVLHGVAGAGRNRLGSQGAIRMERVALRPPGRTACRSRSTCRVPSSSSARTWCERPGVRGGVQVAAREQPPPSAAVPPPGRCWWRSRARCCRSPSRARSALQTT